MTEEKLNKLWYELEDEEKKAEVEYCKMFNSTPDEVPLNEMVRFRSGYCMGRHYGHLAGLHEGQASINSCGDWNNDVHACQMYIRQEEIEKLAHENEQLKAQIEKMKCCGNCKYQVCDESGEFCDYKGMSGISGDCDKWQLKE